MRDRSNAMHTTSESTRGRRRSIRAVSAVPQQCRSSPPRASSCWHLAPGLSLAVGPPQSENRPICSEPGRWAVPPLGPTHGLARSHLSSYQGASFGLFGSQSPIHLGSALVAQVAVVSNLLYLLRRLLWVEVSMMCVLLFMGLWQIHYLKRYFQTKKLI